MENQDAIKYIITKLRAITTMVQIAPFVYAFFCIAAYIMYLFASEKALFVVDLFLYISPIVVVNNLINSRILKLCIWHKTACILPLFPNAVVCFDEIICELPVSYVTAGVFIVIILTALLLIAAHKVFFANGRKR